MTNECPFGGDHFSPASRSACEVCNPKQKGVLPSGVPVGGIVTDHRTSDRQCIHNKNTSANVRIDYLEDSGRYMCEVTLKCDDCGQPFRFLGLPLGLNLNGAAMGVDGLEARLAIMPADRIPHPLQGVSGFGVKAS